MKILFIGDIIGKPGRRIVHDELETIVADRQIDLVVANCENSAAGFGVTVDIAERLLEAGVHVLTSGNHIWDKREAHAYMDRRPELIRPANYPEGAPGGGVCVGTTVGGVPYAVINLQGRVYLPAIDCPFRKADELLDSLGDDVKVRMIDLHAEVTSEMVAFGWYVDGRVSAVVGTHTHIPTADERVLPAGTAYITDVGMTGPHDSIIGMDRTASLGRFLNAMPARFEPATDNPRLNGVVIAADETTGLATAITRVNHSMAELEHLSAEA